MRYLNLGPIISGGSRRVKLRAGLRKRLPRQSKRGEGIPCPFCAPVGRLRPQPRLHTEAWSTLKRHRRRRIGNAMWR